jgi:hypothetical protein
VPTAPSHDAGRYLCNYLCWRAAEAARSGAPRLVAFIHVPRLRHARTWPCKPPLTLDDLTRAGEAILRAGSPPADRRTRARIRTIHRPRTRSEHMPELNAAMTHARMAAGAPYCRNPRFTEPMRRPARTVPSELALFLFPAVHAALYAGKDRWRAATPPVERRMPPPASADREARFFPAAPAAGGYFAVQLGVFA